MKVLITGGAGFIGSHIARAWADRGAEVTVIDDLRTGHRRNLDGVDHRFVQGSILDAVALEEAVRGAQYVFHLAALVSVPHSMEEPELTERLNTGGTIAVLQAAKRAGVAKVVLSSTCAVYGMAERPQHSESHLPEPMSPYAISKLSAEHYARIYGESFGQPTVTLRYFNVYGPQQDPKSAYAAAVALFAERARAGTALTIYGDGEQTRDFVFVEDVVAANILAAEKGEGIYNVCTGIPTSVNNLARQVMETCGREVAMNHAPPRAGDVRHSRGDGARLRALGWSPKVGLAEGLKRTLEG